MRILLLGIMLFYSAQACHSTKSFKQVCPPTKNHGQITCTFDDTVKRLILKEKTGTFQSNIFTFTYDPSTHRTLLQQSKKIPITCSHSILHTLLIPKKNESLNQIQYTEGEIEHIPQTFETMEKVMFLARFLNTHYHKSLTRLFLHKYFPSDDRFPLYPTEAEEPPAYTPLYTEEDNAEV